MPVDELVLDTLGLDSRKEAKNLCPRHVTDRFTKIGETMNMLGLIRRASKESPGILSANFEL